MHVSKLLERAVRKLLQDPHLPRHTQLAGEHRALDSQLFSMARRLVDNRLVAAGLALERLDRRLRDHMAIEEATLFPLAGEIAAPLADDHHAIRRLLDEVAAAIDARDREAALRALARLATCLGEHSGREDAALYVRLE